MKTLLIAMLALAFTSIYDFKLTSLDGKAFDLAAFKGKKILIVNTASACGYTPQYADLEALYGHAVGPWWDLLLGAFAVLFNLYGALYMFFKG